MVRTPLLVLIAMLSIGAASPARQHYHWFPASLDAKPRPWAVLLPRAAGIGKLVPGNHLWDFAKWLNARGIDAIVVDYDGAEAMVPSAKGKTGVKIAAIVADALADAREQGRADMRCSGVAVGWSRGGEGALTLASTAEGGRSGIRLAIVYYPSVRGQDRPYRQLHPVLALQGAADSIAPRKSLDDLVASRTPDAPEFDVHVYQGAKHRFDVAHPSDDPKGSTPSDYDAKASEAALAAIEPALVKYGIPGGCALD